MACGKNNQPNWTDLEIRELLSVRAEEEIDSQLSGTVKDAVVYERLTKILNDRGIRRQKNQIISKLKSLRKKFHQLNEDDGSSGSGKRYWSYFDQCDYIWGSSRSTKPVVVVADVKVEEEETITNFSSHNGEVDCVREESHGCIMIEEAPLTEGEESAAENRPESPYLPPRKRKRLSQAQHMAADMKQMFAEMDNDFHKRESVRLQEQRQYEERVRKDAREHEQKLLQMELEARDRHMGMWMEMQDCQNNLLRDLMDRMPLPTPPRSVDFVNDNYEEIKIDY